MRECRLHRFASLSLKSRIDARKRLFSGKSLHRFPSLGLKSRINARKRLFSGKSLHRFPSLGLKSRIDAAFWLYLRVSLHRFPSLGLKSRIDAAFGFFLRVSLHRFASLGLNSRIDARRRGVPRVLPELAEYHTAKKRAPHLRERLSAVRTRLELATPGVTGRYSNRLNYRTSLDSLERECKDSDFFRFSNSEDIFF